jgi:hypothetical protein
MPKYKDIDIKLSGVDGNVYSILGKCMKAFKKYLNENKLDIGEADSFREIWNSCIFLYSCITLIL